MDYGWTGDQLRFRDDLRAFIQERRTPALFAELDEYHRTLRLRPGDPALPGRPR